MADSVSFYSIIHPRCSCRQENGELHNIGKKYREYIKRIEAYEKEGVQNASVRVLNDMGIRRMCCRSRFMSIPIVPMIDRSKDRVYDDRGDAMIRESTVEIKAKHRLGLPTGSISVIPQKVSAEPELDFEDEFGDIPDDI